MAAAQLINQGARSFKFVDRTFNLSPTISSKILRFFLDQIQLGLFLHFEMVPDRLPDELKELIVKFPKGSLQFEIGIQTFDPDVSKNISRKNDFEKARENFKFLREKTGVHTHADLIVGLPGETLEAFGKGLDQLLELGPDEIQVGVLKLLKGTPIARHKETFKMRYQEQPPFQILETSTMSFETIQKMTAFSKFWDMIVNSGNFRTTVSKLKAVAQESSSQSFFQLFLDLTSFLEVKHAESHSIALLNLVESLSHYLTESLKIDPSLIRECLVQDYSFGAVKRDVPKFLRQEILRVSRTSPNAEVPGLPGAKSTATPKRQLRHQN